MRQTQHELIVPTEGPGLYEISEAVSAWLARERAKTGLVTIFIRHTSASLLIQENADPKVLADLKSFFDRLVPQQRNHYRHDAAGPDDMPAHIRAALTQVNLSIPLVAGRLGLGTWQNIYVFEHGHAAQRRRVLLHYSGD
ncbi:MAG: YjbQ family protein [Alphaproteobacteria bacterium]|nr:YjbQ family protein [Alphaproteobacteria bacterium]